MSCSRKLIGWWAGPDSLSYRCAHPDIFREDLPPDRQRQLFREMIRLVELEPHAICNRACAFCLNSVTGTRAGVMSEALHERILDELSELGYAGTVVYARHCEPLADTRLETLLAMARRKLPSAELKVITNGDLLTGVRLATLIAAGLNRLAVSLYLPETSNWSAAVAEERIRTFAVRLGVACGKWRRYRGGVFAELAIPGLLADVRCLDFKPGLAMRNHGGSVTWLTDPAYQRRWPCPYVFRNLPLDWAGNVMPCCNLHYDYVPHRQFRLGNVREQGMVAIFAGAAAVAWRRKLADFSLKDGPCRHCPDAALDSWRDRWLLAMSGPPPYNNSRGRVNAGE